MFDNLKQATALTELGNVQKMQGYDNYYKVRFGDYRVGLHEENGNVIIKIVMRRKKSIIFSIV